MAVAVLNIVRSLIWGALLMAKLTKSQCKCYSYNLIECLYSLTNIMTTQKKKLFLSISALNSKMHLKAYYKVHQIKSCSNTLDVARAIEVLPDIYSYDELASTSK